MIVVLSPNYLKSDSCDFQTKFAQSLSPGKFYTAIKSYFLYRKMLKAY